MRDEFGQAPVWKAMGPLRVSSEIFLDVIYTSACNCGCPWCIARTRQYAREDRAAWEEAVRDAFRLFDIRNVIILGGEATIDPDFFGKTALLAEMAAAHGTEKLILTTNGIRLREEAFLDRLAETGISAVNLSRMHYDQAVNDRIFGNATLTRDEIARVYRRLKEKRITLRINVNVWRGNLDTVPAMEAFCGAFSGLCDAVKFTPLMATAMFDTVPEVTWQSSLAALPEADIAGLWDEFIDKHILLGRAEKVLGFVPYANVDCAGQRVILKYAQVEDKYDISKEVPTLKIYPNGCLSNAWSFTSDIRARLRKD